jgi:hypothetical protein
MIKRLFTALVLGTVLFGAMSCSKKDDPKPQAGNDYFPTTAGTHWTYNGDIPYTSAITGKTKTIGGQSYFEGTSTSNGTVNTWYVRKDGGAYYAQGFVSLGLDSVGADTVKMVLLKDNVAKGTTWTEVVSIQGIDYKYKFTIDDKDISHSVNGKSFDKVIKVKMDLILDFLGSDLTFATENIYFAYGVGVIETDIVLSALFGGTTESSNLESYEVK